MRPNQIEAVPLSGWGNVRLGDTFEQASQALTEAGLSFDSSSNRYCWDVEDCFCELFFAAGEPERLVQMTFGENDVRLLGQRIVGRSLSEALTTLGSPSYSDTLWSMVDIDCEYEKGQPIDDAERPTMEEPIYKISSGTLWIRSQGIGLCLSDGYVGTLALRIPTDVPRVGCGPLDDETLRAAEDPQLPEKLAALRSELQARYEQQGSSRRLAVKVVLTLLAIALIAVPGYIVYQSIQRWQHATPIVGTVVETRPEGPFPDEIIVEYPLPDETMNRVTIKFSYTTARKVGEEVELLRPLDDPRNAMTRVQASDDGWGLPLPVLLGSLAGAVFLLSWAFPGVIRPGRRRRF